LRISKLAAVAMPQLFLDRTPRFLPLHYSARQSLGSQTIDATFSECLIEFALLNPQCCSTTRAELVIIHAIIPPDRP